MPAEAGWLEYVALAGMGKAQLAASGV